MKVITFILFVEKPDFVTKSSIAFITEREGKWMLVNTGEKRLLFMAQWIRGYFCATRIPPIYAAEAFALFLYFCVQS